MGPHGRLRPWPRQFGPAAAVGRARRPSCSGLGGRASLPSRRRLPRGAQRPAQAHAPSCWLQAKRASAAGTLGMSAGDPGRHEMRGPRLPRPFLSSLWSLQVRATARRRSPAGPARRPARRHGRRRPQAPPAAARPMRHVHGKRGAAGRRPPAPPARSPPLSPPPRPSAPRRLRRRA